MMSAYIRTSTKVVVVVVVVVVGRLIYQSSGVVIKHIILFAIFAIFVLFEKATFL